MNDNFQHFFACVLLHLLIPLAPLLIEYIYNADVTLKSLVMAGAMYSLSISVSSHHLINFVLAFVIGFMFAASYGAVEASASMFPIMGNVSFWGIIFVALTQLFERFDRHVNKGEKFMILHQLKGSP